MAGDLKVPLTNAVVWQVLAIQPGEGYLVLENREGQLGLPPFLLSHSGCHKSEMSYIVSLSVLVKKHGGKRETGKGEQTDPKWKPSSQGGLSTRHFRCEQTSRPPLPGSLGASAPLLVPAGPFLSDCWGGSQHV